ncbi:DNA-binding NarL/FixJ family response regulator [Pseudomonas sp. TE12234]
MHRSATTSVCSSPAPASVLPQETDTPEEVTLTSREKEVLQWVVAGKSSWES